MNREKYTIDASGKVLGRLATKIALLLRGKNKQGFVPYKDEGDFVTVKNAKDVKVSGRKMDQKIYYHYTGYTGGLRRTPIKRMLQNKPAEVLKKAVYRMLPDNKLRDRMIKRLKFED
jgi:large subunit ribosomal protein L13